MVDKVPSERVALAIDVTASLKEVCEDMKRLAAEIGSFADELHRDVHENNRAGIQDKIDKYNENKKKIRAAAMEITSYINLWYDFIKDENRKAVLG